MEEKKHSLQEVQEKLKEIAEEAPETISQRFPPQDACRYIDPEGHPSCIIGRLLDRLGFDRKTVAELDSLAWNAVPARDQEIRHDVWRSFTPEALIYMRRVQFYQDRQEDGNGIGWGKAVEYAERDLTTGALTW